MERLRAGVGGHPARHSQEPLRVSTGRAPPSSVARRSPGRLGRILGLVDVCVVRAGFRPMISAPMLRDMSRVT